MATSQHSINGRIGAYRRWGKTTAAERTRQTEAARSGLLAKFERDADPEGRMTEAERAAAGERLQLEHMNRMSKASAEARASKKKHRVPQEPEPAEATPEPIEDVPDVTRPQVRETDAA